MMLKLLLLCLMICSTTFSFKILVLFPTPSFSHQRPIMALTEKLVKSGHEVFVVSPNKVQELEQHDNYTFIDVSFSYKILADELKNSVLSLKGEMSNYEMLKIGWAAIAKAAESQFGSETFLQFERRVESEKIVFDVVIVEALLIPHTCGMARKLTGAVPIVSISSFPVDVLAERYIGNMVHTSFAPSLLSDYTNKMSFWQKLNNWSRDIWMIYHKYRIMNGAAKQHFKRKYGFGKESLVDGCYENISLALVTSNSLNFYPRSLSSNIIETGPLHLKTPQPLPQTLQSWLDGAEEGVIYFSFGSNIRVESMPAEVLRNFLKVFRELSPRYRVVWKAKFEAAAPDIPQNILMESWLPQHGILVHPKVKLFITHGGFQSLQEAMHYGVPTVGIPRYGDQHCLVSKMVDAGIGVRLHLNDLYSSEKIKEAIEEVLHGARYSKNAKKLSAISHDFSSVALDKATFWVEHVARHGGAAHLRPVTADATLFEFLCLDIITSLLVFSSCVMMFLYLFFKFLLRVYFRYFNNKVKKA
ncbi:unnamed protein product [Bemisia tabaci]|uniref:UDP-glucuronosyltransferase n=1 Tax=Bemisia tabaci TaxID=7038 RepID=A0A9P0F6P6_BEMTA|nr:unnamed protein product [Bemisia tabaci]